MDGFYCKGDAGIIISRALLITVMPEMNKCLSGITVTEPDEWLGRCLLTLTKGEVGCVSKEEIQAYSAIDITGKTDFDPETAPVKEFEDTVAVYPVTDTQMIYKLHKRYSEVEIDLTYRKIETLQVLIKMVVSAKNSFLNIGLRVILPKIRLIVV